MAKRAKIPMYLVKRLLVESKRRCCLCVFLRQDWLQKKVQIAHISKDPADTSYDNLVVLCLDHHDEYDSRTSQSKGITPEEVRHYKARLAEAMRSWENAPHQLVVPYDLAENLRVSSVSDLRKSAPFPVPSSYDCLLDPFALVSSLTDPSQKGEATALLRTYNACQTRFCRQGI